MLAVVACPALYTGSLPAGSLYSTFAACYLKMAGDDMELGPSFQRHVDKAYMGQQKSLTRPHAADASLVPNLHLEQPVIQNNALFQVKQQAMRGVCCWSLAWCVSGRWPCPEPVIVDLKGHQLCSRAVQSFYVVVHGAQPKLPILTG